MSQDRGSGKFDKDDPYEFADFSQALRPLCKIPKEFIEVSSCYGGWYYVREDCWRPLLNITYGLAAIAYSIALSLLFLFVLTVSPLTLCCPWSMGSNVIPLLSFGITSALLNGISSLFRGVVALVLMPFKLAIRGIMTAFCGFDPLAQNPVIEAVQTVQALKRLEQTLSEIPALTYAEGERVNSVSTILADHPLFSSSDEKVKITNTCNLLKLSSRRKPYFSALLQYAENLCRDLWETEQSFSREKLILYSIVSTCRGNSENLWKCMLRAEPDINLKDCLYYFKNSASNTGHQLLFEATFSDTQVITTLKGFATQEPPHSLAYGILYDPMYQDFHRVFLLSLFEPRDIFSLLNPITEQESQNYCCFFGILPIKKTAKKYIDGIYGEFSRNFSAAVLPNELLDTLNAIPTESLDYSKKFVKNFSMPTKVAMLLFTHYDAILSSFFSNLVLIGALAEVVKVGDARSDEITKKIDRYFAEKCANEEAIARWNNEFKEIKECYHPVRNHEFFYNALSSFFSFPRFIGRNLGIVNYMNNFSDKPDGLFLELKFDSELHRLQLSRIKNSFNSEKTMDGMKEQMLFVFYFSGVPLKSASKDLAEEFYQFLVIFFDKIDDYTPLFNIFRVECKDFSNLFAAFSSSNFNLCRNENISKLLNEIQSRLNQEGLSHWRISKMFPEKSPAYFNAYQDSQLSLKKETLEKMRERPPACQEEWFIMGYFLYRDGNVELADNALQNVPESSAFYLLALSERLHCCLVMRDSSQAISIAKTIVACSNSDFIDNARCLKDAKNFLELLDIAIGVVGQTVGSTNSPGQSRYSIFSSEQTKITTNQQQYRHSVPI